MATIGIDIGSINTKALRGRAASPRLRTPLGVSIAVHLAVGLTAIALLRFLPSETASQAPEAIEVSIVSGLPEPATAEPSSVMEMTPAPTPVTEVPSPPEPVAEPLIERVVEPMTVPDPPPAPVELTLAPSPVETATVVSPPAPPKPKPAKLVQRARPKPTPTVAKPVEMPAPQPAALVAPPMPSPGAATEQKPASSDANQPIAVMASATTAARSPASEDHAGLTDTTPIILNPHFRERPTPPTYPKRAMELDQQGETLVRARLDADGNPNEIVLWRTSGFDLLDHAAIEAVKHWRFEPAQRDGRPIPAWVQVPIHFALN